MYMCQEMVYFVNSRRYGTVAAEGITTKIFNAFIVVYLS